MRIFLASWTWTFSKPFLFCRMLCMANNFCNRILFIPILLFIVSLSLSTTSASYCLQEIDAFPGVQIVSLLWTSGDKKLRSRVSNDFIQFLQIFAYLGLLRSTSWLCAVCTLGLDSFLGCRLIQRLFRNPRILTTGHQRHIKISNNRFRFSLL